jgi:hypothetical protein
LTALPAMAPLVHVIHSIPDQRRVTASDGRETWGSMQTVLLIENDPANLVVQALVLRSFGFTVLEASSRGEAWRVCHRHQGPIHGTCSIGSLFFSSVMILNRPFEARRL